MLLPNAKYLVQTNWLVIEQGASSNLFLSMEGLS